MNKKTTKKEAAAAAKQSRAEAKQAEMQKLVDWNAICWLANGDRGISSNTMFTKITGLDANKGWHHDTPSDAWDFARCARLLVVCPQFRSYMVDRLAKSSKKWEALVAQWDVIEAVLRVEWPSLFDPAARYQDDRPHHPKATYEALKVVLKRGERNATRADADETYGLAA